MRAPAYGVIDLRSKPAAPPAPKPVAKARPAPKPKQVEKAKPAAAAKPAPAPPKKKKEEAKPPQKPRREERKTRDRRRRDDDRWDDRQPAPAKVEPPAPPTRPEPNPRRRKPAYRPQWLDGGGASQQPDRKKPAYSPPPPPAREPKRRPPPPAKKRYTPPPPPSAQASPAGPAKAAAPLASVFVRSTTDAPVTRALIDNILGQELIHPFEVVVIRAEREAAVSKAVERPNVREIAAAGTDKLFANSDYDGAFATVDSELMVIIAADTRPQGTRWLHELLAPLVGDPTVVATRGRVVPERSLPPYLAYRFEQERDDPLDFLAARRSAWEGNSLQKSGNLGGRWLERMTASGRLVKVDTAVAEGTYELAESFRTLVRDSFANLPHSLATGAKNAVSETLADWDALRTRDLDAPGPTYARAAMTRIAENIGKTRWKILFGPANKQQ